MLICQQKDNKQHRELFRIIRKSKKSRARLGVVNTSHGKIKTPAFIPVATRAAIKGLTINQVKSIGAQVLLCNTYHLYLRPGEGIINRLGGLHKFMGWNGPIVTDSGGFQAFSMGVAKEHGVGKIGKGRELERVATNKKGQSLVKITENGVQFKSHLDGSKHLFTPEKSIQIQQDLGADIIFTFDECTSPLGSYEYTKQAMIRTHCWAERCLNYHSKQNQQLFGIVQGGEYRDLREKSAKFISSLSFSGFGLGGSLGKVKKDMYNILDWTIPLLPENKPRHLLGIGDIQSIRQAVKRGVDTFDCVLPTRLARNGVILTGKGGLNLLNARYKTNKKYAYLHHLFKVGEMLGPILATIHNLEFMEGYMEQLREEIKEGKL